MSKSNHVTGQPVFSRLLNLISESKILEISRSTGKNERYVKHLDGYTHLVVMLYGGMVTFWEKKMKPLHFFHGDSVNAIQVQTWVVLIANLLCTVIQRMIEKNVSFSQIVTMIRNTLMYYIDFI